jgi:LysR family glycine cleavage system transcriptional activator
VAACSPDLLKRSAIKTTADLAHHSLLHVDDHRMWEQWLRRAGADEALAEKGLLMSDRHFQLSATLSGVGVSLFVKSFIENELEKGSLVCPLALEYETDYAYYLARSKHLKLDAAAMRFYDWILGQALTEQAPGEHSR